MTHRAAVFLSLFVGICSLASTARAQEAPLELEEAIRLALAKNYAISVESYNLPIAKANVLAEYGRFDPSLQLQYRYSENANPQPIDTFSGSRPPSVAVADSYDAGITGLTPWGTQYFIGGSTENLRNTGNKFVSQYYSFAGIDLTQPLLRDFGFGAGLATVRIAKTDRALSEWDYRQAVMDTITNVIVAYHDLFLATQTLRATMRSRDLAANLLAENERRFQVGNVSDADVTTARARAAFREDSILRADRAVKFRTNVLRQLISDERDPILLNLPITLVPPPPAPPDLRVNPVEDFRVALTQRPDYQRSRLLVQRQRLNRTFQANQRLPRVDLVGRYGYHGLGGTWPESRRNLQDRDTRSYTAGAVVTVPLTFAQQRGRYRAASLQLKQAETRAEQVEQQVLLDVANVAADVESALKRIVAAQRARELAQRSLGDELKLHRAGNSSTLFVLQAQELLSSAELNEFAATSDAHKAIAEYDRQLGRTLEKHRVQLGDRNLTQPTK